MRHTFTLGLLLGFLGLLTATYFYPLVNHARVESRTTVALNGGRTETFLIRLPVDRISSIGDSTTGIRGHSHPAGQSLPSEFEGTSLLVEHFKLRDVDGNVIGLAAHHSTEGAEGTLSVWAFQIPGRGTVVFSGPAAPPNQIDRALQAAGYAVGQQWSGQVDVDSLSRPGDTRVIDGTEEFGGIQGNFEQIWRLTGVSATGELRGTIEFRTIVSRPQ